MDIVQVLREDYERFPVNQTYSIYAEKVFFQDPLNRFQGVERYKQMIAFLERWFADLKMDLHDIQQNGNSIRTEWTLKWRSPLPWQPRIAITGWSELQLDATGLIGSHVDHWHCSRWDVLRQHFWTRDEG
ncbi:MULTISPECIES: DUF2358 domain-containing protein [Trichocoleus]|uniref:DUF2358 domain-containing protein n=1 Tax=Trichocoleus desertorum GB2-A4 TaxID=2933944 RepID=A0ABV0J871_9CYAN|nr:DUF2358 domain-containing protein [Trichocoleus sp. FACHB-46]MBD1860985.1 DUF2358 domain-containing protein [Trichocoleus sp. FACHB-46]